MFADNCTVLRFVCVCVEVCHREQSCELMLPNCLNAEFFFCVVFIVVPVLEFVALFVREPVVIVRLDIYCSDDEFHRGRQYTNGSMEVSPRANPLDSFACD